MIDTSNFARVARACDIAPGSSRVVSVGRWEVAVFHTGGEFFALENSCPHQGGPLADGWLEDGTITCPWHGWCFDLRTGSLTLGDFARVERFEVQVVDGIVWVANRPDVEE
ncbi:MAG: Rieske 2Fe-2S domain-containing protein [Candidatus Eremiobacteraeota bacterium]|nr:Rieske 2Fe-2S domain-containing protein [Candidatus Eremiobacteraeota bacterium]